MGTHLRFTLLLPTTNAPWLPEPLHREHQGVFLAQEDLIAKRYEAVSEALRNRPSGEACRPVRITSLPLLSQELHFRRAVEEFTRKAVAASRAYLEEAAADLEPAEAAARAKLRDAGYTDPTDEGVHGSYTAKMVRRHPIVQAVVQRRAAVERFIDRHEAIRRDNLRWAEELTAKLRRLRSEAPSLAV